jgi:hypothetical protein
MTQHYLAGELSLRLAQLQAVVGNQASVDQVRQLRREAETTPPAALTAVVVHVLEVTDGLCWDSLARGDAGTFSAEAAISAELSEFGVCAGLLHDD